MNTVVLRTIVACALATLLCDARADGTLAPFAGAGAGSDPAPPWHVVGLPQQTKPFTQFAVVDVDGHHAVRIDANQSYGNLVESLPSLHVPAHLAWQWRVERPLLHSDLHSRDGDDSAVKVCVLFDEPMDAIPFGERQFLRIARGRTSEPVPAATICYVWDANVPANTEIDNAFVRRNPLHRRRERPPAAGALGERAPRSGGRLPASLRRRGVERAADHRRRHRRRCRQHARAQHLLPSAI